MVNASVLTVPCTACQSPHRVSSEHLGRKLKCKSCGTPFLVAEPAAAGFAPAPAPAAKATAPKPAAAAPKREGSIRERMDQKREKFRFTALHGVMILAVIGTAIGYMLFNN